VALLSQSVGLTRYRVAEEIPGSLWQQVPALLKKNAFRDIDATTDERSFGWTSFDDMLDTGFTAAPPEKGHYLAFALRLETRRIPPAVFKKHLAIALRDELAKAKEQGRSFVSRDRKREIKEQVGLRLRAKTLPVPAVFDAVWDMRSGRVLLASTNAKVRALFEDYFGLTFGLKLEPLVPFFLALDILGEDAAGTLEGLEPAIFV
jgi:hypothetical protein